MVQQRGLFLILLLLCVLVTAHAEDAPVCPKCGAPLEPGAAFCTRCGYRLSEKPGTPQDSTTVPNPRDSVVQVVALYDKQLTSAEGSILWGSNVSVGSLLGSAFATGRGEFVTDAGLLVGAKEIALQTSSGRSVPARVIGIDPMIGVALLGADLGEVPPLGQRASGLPRLGEGLTALGFPSRRRASRDLATSAGVVSGLHRRDLRMHPVEDYIQTDASLPDGFAGGPVVDAAGKLIGMSTAWTVGPAVVLGPTVGIGVSIPLEWIERALTWIRDGSPSRPWIGACAVATDADSLKHYGLPPRVRWVVQVTFPGAPAASAGLQPGDGLLKVGGVEVVDLFTIEEKLLGSRPGEVWSMEVARGRETRVLSLTLASRPDRTRLGGLDALQVYGGLEMLPKGDSAIAVVRVIPGSEASRAKVTPGDVLQSMLVKKDLEHAERDLARWRSVKNLEDLKRFVEGAYSDIDFFIGMQFKGHDGQERRLFLRELQVPITAL